MKLKDRVDLGQLFVFYQRLAIYMGMFNFLGIFYLTMIVENPLGLPLIVIGVGLFIFVAGTTWFDNKFVYPKMLKYTWDKNPRMNTLEEKIDKIAEHLGVEF